MVVSPKLHFSFRTDCIDLAFEDGFIVRTIYSAYYDKVLLLRTVSDDSTLHASFRSVLDLFRDRPERWIAEWLLHLQRVHSMELAMAAIVSLGPDWQAP
jgi:hypothetical protein